MKNPLFFLLLPLVLLRYLVLWILRRAKPWDGKSPLERTHQWYKVPLEGYVCSEGSPFSGCFKRGTRKDKTVFYLAGGGLSWNEHTADASHHWRKLFTGREIYYNPNIGPIHEIGLDGILAKNDRNNPFNDWNFAALPYASGDLHMGDKDFPYTATDGSKCICHHHGLRNLDALLKLAVETFPHTKTLLITGSSAGAFGAVANAPRIARAFPQIQRTVIFADGAQGRYPGWKQVLRDVWNADPLYVDALDDEGRLIKVLFEQAWKALGDQAVYLHSNTTHDGVLCGLENAMNRGRMDTSPEALDFFNAALREDTAALAAELPRYRYYVTNYRRNPKTGVTGHTFIGGRLFTRAAMEEGRTLARWLDDAVNRDILVNAGERHIV